MIAKIFFLFTCWLALCATLAQSPNIQTKKWEAFWITVPDEPAHDFGVYNFRKKFELPAKPHSFVIHVSADNRYKLFVNEKLVSLGPARGDLFHWKFETVDIAPHLIAGENTITAIGWNFGSERPEPQISLRTAFILQGNSQQESIVNTNQTWKCLRDNRYTPLKPELLYVYYVAGPGERIDFNLGDSQWMTTNYDDAKWKNSQKLFNGVPKGVFDWSTGWMLIPRDIPAMELRTERLRGIRKTEGITPDKNFLSGNHPISVPAKSKIKLLLDQEHLTNAYPTLIFSRGKDATLTIGYAESLYVIDTTRDWRSQRQKGNRNEVEGKRFVGVKDHLVSNGNDHQSFTSLHFRTYRYIQLEVITQNEPLLIEDIYGTFTGYPFKKVSAFKSSDAALDKILDVGWRTARLCATETYMDCPYYEQLQYIGDTRIQALVTLYNTSEDALVKNAITQLDNSRMAEGITLSRYPTANAQQIPTFSLWWIAMLHDYWWYRPDEKFVQNKLSGVREVLRFFKNYQQADGSLKQAPYWEFTDWAEGNGWERGTAPEGADGASSVLDLQLCWAYQLASELEEKLGSVEQAKSYRLAADVLKKTIRSKYWSESHQLFSDTSEKKYFSQHANVLAILAEVVQGQDAELLMEEILSEKSLTQATIYFKYYLHLALNKTGKGNRYLQLLDDWHDQLANGLTTWAEISNHNMARSDCHAWGASPNIEFYRIVLGIDSDEPGFNKVKIKPHLGSLKEAAGTISHHRGMISVKYSISQGKLLAQIQLPEGLSGRFLWKDREIQLHSGNNELKL
jgi:alpha-L-rhamnosidase